MRHAPRFAVFFIVAGGLLLVAHLVDGWAYRQFVNPEVYDRDWGKLLRVMGYLPTWLLAATAMALVHTGRRPALWSGHPLRPAALLALGPTLAGIGAEVLKIVIRRQRPSAGEAEYLFRAWSDETFATAGLGAPSSHATVAFAAAFVLCRLYPRASPIWLLLAVGCALTRVLHQVHFVSDVVLGGILAYVIVWLIWPKADAYGQHH